MDLQSGSLTELESIVCQFWRLPAGALSRPGQTTTVTEARGALGWLVTEYDIAPLPVVTKHLNRSRSSLRGLSRRFDERLKNPKMTKVLTERLLRVIELLPVEAKTKRVR
jgi:hypothetical protein